MRPAPASERRGCALAQRCEGAGNQGRQHGGAEREMGLGWGFIPRRLGFQRAGEVLASVCRGSGIFRAVKGVGRFSVGRAIVMALARANGKQGMGDGKAEGAVRR